MPHKVICPIRSKEVNNTLVTHMPRGRPPKTGGLSLSSNPWRRYNPKLDDKEYLDSDRWKCEKSPTKAHHWIIAGRKAECKYCLGLRHLNTIGLFEVKTDLDAEVIK